MRLRHFIHSLAFLALCTSVFACADEDDVPLPTSEAGNGGQIGDDPMVSYCGAGGYFPGGNEQGGGGNTTAGAGGEEQGGEAGNEQGGGGSTTAGAGGTVGGQGGSTTAGAGGTVGGQGGSTTAGAGGTVGGQGGSTTAGTGGTAGAGQGGAGSTCSAEVKTFPLDPSPHVDMCLPLTFSTNPPSSGSHYGTWAAYKSYAAPIPRGFWVHSMEHGAVVLIYNCPDGCASDVAELQKLIDVFPDDPLCTDPAGSKKRLVLVEDPKLDVRFAAASWGATLRASCLDQGVKAQISAFMVDHYAKGAEDICAPGVDIATMTLPDKCGEPDYVPPQP